MPPAGPETLVTVGEKASIAMDLLTPSDPVVPGAGSVSVAGLPAISTIVPAFGAKASVLV